MAPALISYISAISPPSYMSAFKLKAEVNSVVVVVVIVDIDVIGVVVVDVVVFIEGAAVKYGCTIPPSSTNWSRASLSSLMHALLA